MSVRARLTALYAALFGVSGAVLLGVSWWLMRRHLHRTLPRDVADDAIAQLRWQFLLAFAGTMLVSVALGWAMSGRALAPVARMTALARRVSEERLGERLPLDGPDDELRELAATLNAMLDRLAEAFESQRRFVANASHELRSPLTVIRAEADVALANPDADVAELRAMGHGVVEAVERTEALLDSLLTLARTQGGQLGTDTVDLAETARAAARAAAPGARAGSLQLRVAAEPASVTGDRRLLERVVGNLVENAVRYNHPGGFVSVETSTEGGRATLRVENTGPMLDPEVVRRLAQPFERLERGRDRQGAGLGLSIVRTVAEAHGGSLSLAARPAGGVVAAVAIPAQAGRANQRSDSSAPPATSTSAAPANAAVISRS
jgi:signal transduction histidine kinase